MLLKEIAPPDSNGVHRETRYTWEQKQAMYKVVPGGLPVASGSPIWKLVATSTCKTLPGAQCVGTNDETKTSISYNGNLLPTSSTIQNGTGSESQTTARSYDYAGKIEWIDGPAGSGDRIYYFWDAARQSIGEIGPDPDGVGPLPRPATRRHIMPTAC